MEADRHEGIFYNTAIDSPFFDCQSVEADKNYLKKVYALVTLKPEAVDGVVVPDGATDIYEMRFRQNWAGADTFYDCWLLAQGKRRAWFPYQTFVLLFPDAEEKISSIVNSVNSEEGNSDNDQSSDGDHLRILSSDDEWGKPRKRARIDSSEESENEESETKVFTIRQLVNERRDNRFVATPISGVIVISDDDDDEE